MISLVQRLGHATRRWVQGVSPWTNVYGTARSLLALATAGTLAFTSTGLLFGSPKGEGAITNSIGPAKWGLFYLAGKHLHFAQLAMIVCLLVIATGWRPRWTGILHWWLCFSFAANATLIDGGDQIAAILTLFLIPVTLLDKRKWHWLEPPVETFTVPVACKRLVAMFCFLLIRIQVSGIYLHSSIAKLSVKEWVNGTAVYYWFTHPNYGAPPWRLHLLRPLLTDGLGVAAITWGAILLELALFMALVMPRRAWPWVMALGITFHAMIALIHGLVSFAGIMTAALILYLRPVEQSFQWSSARSVYSRLRSRMFAPLVSPAAAQPENGV